MVGSYHADYRCRRRASETADHLNMKAKILLSVLLAIAMLIPARGATRWHWPTASRTAP
jgi:hypothetical protein